MYFGGWGGGRVGKVGFSVEVGTIGYSFEKWQT